VGVGKFADLMARAPKLERNFATLTIENLHLFVATIGHIHVSLFAVRRKSDPPSGPPIIGKAASLFNPDTFFELSQFIEYLDRSPAGRKRIRSSSFPKSYAVHDLHERTTNTRVRFLFCALMPPLPEEFSIRLKQRSRLLPYPSATKTSPFFGSTAISEGI